MKKGKREEGKKGRRAKGAKPTGRRINRGPKPNRPIEYSHKSAHYAAREKCTLRTVNNWMRAGAPLDDRAAFGIWLASRKNTTPAVRGEDPPARRPAGPPASDPPASAHPPDAIPHPPSQSDTGAPAALRRLADAELSSWNDLQEALSSDLGPFNIKLAHERWLKTGDSLRKYDLMVEQSRRDSGELMPRSEVERILEAVAYYLRMAGQQLAISLADRFAKLSDPAEINHLLNHAQWEQLLGTFSGMAAKSSGGMATPGWAINALCRDIEHVLDQVPEIRAERAQIFKECMDEVYQSLPQLPAA